MLTKEKSVKRSPLYMKISIGVSTIFALILTSNCLLVGHAQSSSSPTPSASNTNPDPALSSSEQLTPTDTEEQPKTIVAEVGVSSFEFMMTIMIVAISLIALGMEFLLLRRMPKLRPEDTLRVFAVTLIILGTLFFITAGFDSKQIAPAMGLFGTVAGYLLGRSTDRKGDKDSE